MKRNGRENVSKKIFHSWSVFNFSIPRITTTTTTTRFHPNWELVTHPAACKRRRALVSSQQYTDWMTLRHTAAATKNISSKHIYLSRIIFNFCWVCWVSQPYVYIMLSLFSDTWPLWVFYEWKTVTVARHLRLCRHILPWIRHKGLWK